MEAKSLGQIAYDAYGEHQGWVTVDGHQMVSWESVDVHLKAAWQSEGKAVAVQVTRAWQQSEIAALDAEPKAEEP